MKAFDCDGCGKCCRNVGQLPLPSVDGTCRLYDPTTNRCVIYHTRPLICRVDMYHVLMDTQLSLEEWHRVNKEACKQIGDMT